MRGVVLFIMLVGAVAATGAEVQVRQLVTPTYPRLAWLAKLEGTVEATLEIDRDGQVQTVKAAGADPLLLRETEKNIRQWTFVPFREPSKSHASLKVRYIYKLEGEAQDVLSPPRVIITLPDTVDITARPPSIICILYADEPEQGADASRKD